MQLLEISYKRSRGKLERVGQQIIGEIPDDGVDVTKVLAEINLGRAIRTGALKVNPSSAR